MLRSFSYFSDPILDARKEENHPFHGIEDSVLEEVADGTMEDASLAVTAREAAGITFLATASAAFFAGTDILMSFGWFSSDLAFVVDVGNGGSGGVTLPVRCVVKNNGGSDTQQSRQAISIGNHNHPVFLHYGGGGGVK